MSFRGAGRQLLLPLDKLSQLLQLHMYFPKIFLQRTSIVIRSQSKRHSILLADLFDFQEQEILLSVTPFRGGAPPQPLGPLVLLSNPSMNDSRSSVKTIKPAERPVDFPLQPVDSSSSRWTLCRPSGSVSCPVC